MKKIIVKAKIRNREDFERAMEEKTGEDFSSMYWLHDRVYVPREYKRGMNYPTVTVRTEMRAVDRPAKYILKLKRHIEDSGVDISDETVVKDYVETVEIARQFGMELKNEVSMRRQELKTDDYIMYLDKVEGLSGYYAKCEKILKDGDVVSKSRDEMLEMLNSCGAGDVVVKKYSEQLSK